MPQNSYKKFMQHPHLATSITLSISYTVSCKTNKTTQQARDLMKYTLSSWEDHLWFQL